MTARTPPPWRWGAWAERHELKVCLQRGEKRSRGKRRSSVGQNSSQSLSDTLWNMEDIVALIDARDERAKKIDAENATAIAEGRDSPTQRQNTTPSKYGRRRYLSFGPSGCL